MATVDDGAYQPALDPDPTFLRDAANLSQARLDAWNRVAEIAARLAELESSRPEGDMRNAFFLGYDPATVDYVTLAEARQQVATGRELVSATLVVPYPPGFPVLVPGQVVSAPILDFLTHLDVGEIHGYDPDLGLSVFTDAALAT